jgi:D-alanyl-D-alanine carboxypeptidase
VGARTSEVPASGRGRMGNGETKLTTDHPTLRGRPGVVAGLLGALAVTVAVLPADARHSAARHASHESRASHESPRATHESSSGPPYAAIVVDANSGNVLHSANADELRHPASLTKIMTLYLLFERLESGKLKLDTQLPVSEHASVQAPTKLGLKPNQTIAVEDAIGGLVTKSANDAAVVIAEAIGGDEPEFADLMTRKAHALGMSRTVYRNASGLPNDEQVTTARDQATLGRAIQERFPRYYRYFSMSSFTYHGQSMRNHNHLLGHVEGMDGIKTGYTQASGFNLVTSVHRNNRHIVSVVLGGASAGARDARMQSLIEQYIVAAAPQKSTTAVAEATRDPQAADTRTAETLPFEARPAETRPAPPAKFKSDARSANRAVAPTAPATYSVASYGRPVTWPIPAPAAPGAVATNPQTAPVDDTTPTAAVGAPGGKPTAQPAPPQAPATAEPIRPIQVKTVKVKLAQVAAVATAPAAPSSAPAAATEPLQDRVQDRASAPPLSASQALAAPTAAAPQTPAAQPKPAAKAGMLGTLTSHDQAPVVELKRDAAVIREAARETTPSAPSQPATPQTAVPQVSAPQNAAPQNAAPQIAPRQLASIHSGWVIQVGAFEVERDAHQKLSAVQAKAGQILGHANPFTEPVVKGDKTLYRARFTGLEKDEAEAACRQLKRNDIDCITIKN